MRLSYDKLWKVMKNNKLRKGELAAAAEVSEYTMSEMSGEVCRVCPGLEPDGQDVFAHIKIDLVTGRRHQIRLQLSNAGMPIVGDRKYGVVPEGYKGDICLAATELSFRHPSSDERMMFDAEPSFARGQFLR